MADIDGYTSSGNGSVRAAYMAVFAPELWFWQKYMAGLVLRPVGSLIRYCEPDGHYEPIGKWVRQETEQTLAILRNHACREFVGVQRQALMWEVVNAVKEQRQVEIDDTPGSLIVSLVVRYSGEQEGDRKEASAAVIEAHRDSGLTQLHRDRKLFVSHTNLPVLYYEGCDVPLWSGLYKARKLLS